MKHTPIKQGSFRRLLRNLRKDSEGEMTPIQALRLKQQGSIRIPKLSKPIKAHWDDRRSHPMVKKIPGLPSRPEYKIKRWNEVERSTVQGRKAGPLAVHCFTATAKRKARKAKLAENKPAKRSDLPRSSSQRAQQRRQYNKRKPSFLLDHPFCQITIAYLGLDEADVIKHNGAYRKDHQVCCGAEGYCFSVPRADQLHHRNKTNGIRLINFDYIMTSCAPAHTWLENHLNLARALGLLCPINCKPDGTMPDGTKQPTTTELLAQRHQYKCQSQT